MTAKAAWRNGARRCGPGRPGGSSLRRAPPCRRRRGTACRTLPNRRSDAALHLDTPVRSLRSTAAPAWVDEVLAGNAAAARAWRGMACRSASPATSRCMRARLRRACRGTRRAGLLCSSGARRLRAEGLGRDAAARRSGGGGALVPRPLPGRARLRRPGGGGHRVLRPGFGAGCRRVVLGWRPGLGWVGLAGRAFRGTAVDAAARLRTSA